MTLQTFKESLISSGIFKQTPTNRDQYRCQTCPRCGDNKYHCYVKICLNNEEPPLWHCFKCNSSGVVGKEFLKAYGLDHDIDTPTNVKYHKRIESNDAASIKLNQVSCDESNNIAGIVSYINSRVGVQPTLSDLQTFRYVGDPHAYVKQFFGNDEYNHNVICWRHWFQLNNGNIIGRCNNDDTEYRWLRYKTKRVHGRGIYTMRVGMDTHEPINIIIAEGIMDVIGLYYHHPIPNTMYIATLGSDYKAGIDHMLKMGIFGNSVHIHIFKDSDVDNNNIRVPYGMRQLFKHIYVYQNTIDKDYGVSNDKMEIHRVLKIK